MSSFLDFRNTRFFWRKPLCEYSKIKLLYSTIIGPCYSSMIRNRSFQIRKLDLNRKRYLNLGCSCNIEPRFINLDYNWIPGVDLCWDLRKKISLPDQSIEGAYSEHCLEHLSLDDCRRLLIDIKRILKKSAIFRIVVPDAGLFAEIYYKNKSGVKTPFPIIYKQPGDGLEDFTPMMHLNRIFRDFEHMYAYDEETLIHLLNEAGYKSVKKMSYRQGSDPKLLIDSEWRAPESLYMEAKNE